MGTLLEHALEHLNSRQPHRRGIIIIMGTFWTNGIFDADFACPTLVQVFFIIQCIWTGCMGVLVTYDPDFSPINANGVFIRKPGTKKNGKGSKWLPLALCTRDKTGPEEGLSQSEETP